MFHVKRPVGIAETGLFRVECSNHQLPFHFSNFADQGICMGPVELGGWIVQQQRRWSTPIAPDQLGHRERKRRAQQLLLPAG